MALQSITALSKITLQEASPTVEFSGIPDTYRDLLIVINAKSTASTSYVSCIYNSDSGNNYSRVGMAGPTAGFASTTNKVNFGGYSYASTDFNFNALVEVVDYSVTDKHTTTLVRANRATAAVDALAVRWADTAVITDILFQLSTGSFDAGTTIALFGRIA